MMIIITKQDLARMSPVLRNELMQVMFDIDDNSVKELSEETIDFEEYQQFLNETPPPLIHINDSMDVKKTKSVIEIDEEQAKSLIANLSDKSINTLKKFTTSDPVEVESLVGTEKLYTNFIELKRSFVGPVNRRLRTVTGNRSAMLFLKADDDTAKISVKLGTALALKKVLEC
jgi:hypothetical protein